MQQMPDKKQTILTATGDMMFYGPLDEKMREHSDPLWGFRKVAQAITSGDILFGNFETPISNEHINAPDAPNKYFSRPGTAKAVKMLGYNVVNLANNHIYDFGSEGVEATLNEMFQARLPYFGIGRNAEEAAKPAIVTSRTGVKFGFIGYTTANNALDPKHKYVACFPSINKISADIAALVKEVDVVVISCHTGSQYNPYPAPETRKLARAAIEAGALIFLGHHSHVPQGIERIGRGLAVYSLGDFVAPVHTEDTRRTFFVRIKVEGAKVSEYETVPCYITNDCQTIIAEGALAEDVKRHIEKISKEIEEGKSDELHFGIARKRFFWQYVKSWLNEFKYGGVKVFIRKIKNLRYYHLQLVISIVFGKLFRINRKN